MTTGPGVEVRALEAGYGGVCVLHGLDLTVERGRLACVLGPSGCGKTTLLRVLAGFQPAWAGSVVVGGRVVEDRTVRLPSEKRRVGYVPQEGALFAHLSVAANVGFGLPRHSRGRRSKRRRRVEELLELVGLAGLGDRHPHDLSGGQQQRVALARALAPEPEVVLLDEPFAALDAGLRHRLRLDVRRVLETAGATSVLVTHDQTEALSLGDQVALMRAGRVVQAGTPTELYACPRDDWAARFLGEATLLPAEVAEGVAHTSLGLLPLVSTNGNGALRGPVHVIIRPEQIVLEQAVCPGEGNGSGPLWGEVTRTEYFGHDALVEVRVAARSHPVMVLARVPGPARPPQPGSRVTLAVRGPIQAVSTSGEVGFAPPSGAEGGAPPDDDT